MGIECQIMKGIIMYIVSFTILDYDNGAIVNSASILSIFIHFADFKRLSGCDIENKEVTNYQQHNSSCNWDSYDSSFKNNLILHAKHIILEYNNSSNKQENDEGWYTKTSTKAAIIFRILANLFTTSTNNFSFHSKSNYLWTFLTIVTLLSIPITFFCFWFRSLLELWW